MTQTIKDERLKMHRERSRRLASLIHQHLVVLEKLEMNNERTVIQPLEQSVLSDTFKILVMGEFNRGKSTLINAMLGKKVLPAYPIETTAIINEIKWGEHPRALLHYHESNDAAQKVKEVSIGEIEKYVIAKNKSYDNPYDKVELFWPLELCHDGVEIIDSPGLNVVSRERQD